ncbi:MAG: CPBP family intramembrane metalloprotease [Planctomycetaceae bacterium]|nr:CPBP family intramembrane metalloprotease [Planctomycetaceae bacterium]
MTGLDRSFERHPLCSMEVGRVKPASPWISKSLAICEAVAWTVAYLVGQGLVLLLLLALMLTACYGFNWPDPEEMISLFLVLELDRSFMLVGATSLGVLFVIIPLIRLREGRNYRNRIGWRTPTREEWIFSLATVAPIAMIGDLVFETARSVSLMTSSSLPFAAALRETSLQHLYSTLDGVSFPVLVVALALGPAIGEELIFRGVIGRRLVGTLGPAWGVALTSICFAAAHGSWSHAVATIPVAILLHWLYLQTRTIWVPIAVHFCNNLLALSMFRLSLTTESVVSPLLASVLSIYLIGILLLLKTRIRPMVATT